MLHPVNRFAIKLLLYSDVGHCRGCRSAMPVFLTWRKPDHVTRPDFLNGPTPTLRSPATRSHDQMLTQRVRVPRGSGARLERDNGSNSTRRSGRTELRINPHGPCEIFCRPFARWL
jgi:hypothetical protein